MRSIDYLETRSEIDSKKSAFMGVSWGSALGPIVPTVEPRVGVAVPALAGLPMQRALPREVLPWLDKYVGPVK